MLFRAAISVAVFTTLCASAASAQPSASPAAFNPAISLILDGRYTEGLNDPDAYALPGFMLGGEAGSGVQGFGLGHSELVMSTNVDDMFYGQLTAALHVEGQETALELEEAFVETLALGSGLTVRAGRFFSGFGYLNAQHNHTWDFVDAPLIYRALFGEQLIDDGLQLRWVAPTELFVQLGAEAGRGERFPAGGAANDGRGTRALFIKVGGDAGASHAWQVGVSRWRAEVAGRTAGAHSHDGATAETPSFSGDSRVSALDLVWKWAPNGNALRTALKLQAEYFWRDEEGEVTLVGSDPLELSSTTGASAAGTPRRSISSSRGGVRACATTGCSRRMREKT